MCLKGIASKEREKLAKAQLGQELSEAYQEIARLKKASVVKSVLSKKGGGRSNVCYSALRAALCLFACARACWRRARKERQAAGKEREGRLTRSRRAARAASRLPCGACRILNAHPLAVA